MNQSHPLTPRPSDTPAPIRSAELDRQRLAAVLARALAQWCQTHYADDPLLRADWPAASPAPTSLKRAA